VVSGCWWFLIAAIALHAVGKVLVLGAIGNRLRQQDKPDPVTEARMEERPGPEDRPHPAH
jgi:hypothetical protein